MGQEFAAHVVAWVKASCEAQGVPVKVEDSRVLREVGVLLGGGAGGGRALDASASSAPRPAAS